MFASEVDTHPVQRGKLVRDNFLCRGPLAVPPNVPPSPGTTSAKTVRAQLEAMTANAPCISCHEQLNPLGFAFEIYDPVGRFRTTEAGLPIDATGTAKNVAANDIQHTGAIDLSTQLSALPQAQACFTQQMGRSFLGREVASDSCELARAYDRFQSSGGKIVDTVAAYVAWAANQPRTP
jgi:hypothetical protein